MVAAGRQFARLRERGLSSSTQLSRTIADSSPQPSAEARFWAEEAADCYFYFAVWRGTWNNVASECPVVLEVSLFSEG